MIQSIGINTYSQEIGVIQRQPTLTDVFIFLKCLQSHFVYNRVGNGEDPLRHFSSLSVPETEQQLSTGHQLFPLNSSSRTLGQAISQTSELRLGLFLRL